MTLLCTALSVLCVGVKCKILHFTLFVLSRVEFPGLSALTKPGFTPLTPLSPHLHNTIPNFPARQRPDSFSFSFDIFQLSPHPYQAIHLYPFHPSSLVSQVRPWPGYWDEVESEVSADPVQWLQPGQSLLSSSGARDTSELYNMGIWWWLGKDFFLPSLTNGWKDI